MKLFNHALILVSMISFFVAGCATAPDTQVERQNLVDQATSALRQMKNSDPTLTQFLAQSFGYAVFPNVGKGAFIAGGAYGRGIVYEKGNFVGYSDVAQATIGLQAGGQSFDEIIVFENRGVMDRFISGKVNFSASASAVILKSGAGGAARYTDGVAVFVQPTGGLMVEAAVGGQQFTFMPK
jgi:lipid-binding SYLF domain-containing protein